MKEWAIKHPILTFLLADTIVAGIVNVIIAFAGPKAQVIEVEETENESEEE